MRTLTRVHQFSPAAFIFKAEPLPKGPMVTPFPCIAYAFGQLCLPYSVPVRRLRYANRAQS